MTVSNNQTTLSVEELKAKQIRKANGELNATDLSSMNKTELRSALSKDHGIVLTPAELKKATADEMREMYLAKQMEQKMVINPLIVSNTKGDDNMMTETNAIAQLAAILKGNNDKVVATIKEESTNVIVPAVQQNGAHIINELKAEINKLAAQVSGLKTVVTSAPIVAPNQRTSVPSNAPVVGECAVCGYAIKSANVVKFSTETYGKTVCFKCQKDDKVTKVTKPNTNKVSIKCTSCNKVMSMTIDAISKAKASAVAKGLPAGVYHKACGQALLAPQAPQIPQASQTPEYTDTQEIPDSMRESMDQLDTQAPVAPQQNIYAQSGAQISFSPTPEQASQGTTATDKPF